MSTQFMNRRTCAASATAGMDAGHPCADEVAGNVVHPVLSARPFNFDGVSGSSSVELIVADSISTSGIADGYLDVRLHQGSVGPSATIEVVVYVAAPSTDDPAQSFRSTTEAANVVLEDVTVSAPGGVLKTAAISGQLGSFVTVAVRGSQGSQMQPCNGTLSADLVLRRRQREHIGGTRVVALPQTELDFTSLGSSATESRVLVRALDVSDYRTGYLALRVHRRSINAGASLVVRVHGTLPDPVDPNTDFVVPVSDSEHSFTIAAGTSSEVQTVRLPSNFGPFLYVRLDATQSAGGGDLSAAISLDFVGQQ